MYLNYKLVGTLCHYVVLGNSVLKFAFTSPFSLSQAPSHATKLKWMNLFSQSLIFA